MRDFKYMDLISQKHEWDALMIQFNGVRSACLIPCAQAFRDNIQRTVDFSVLPTEIAFVAWRDARFCANAFAKEGGAPILTPSEHASLEFSKAMFADHARQMEEFNALPDHEKQRIRRMAALIVTEISVHSNGTRAAMDALLTAIILESWLFFEAFCSDLWVASVDNASPKMMASLLENSRWEKTEQRAYGAPRATANPKTHPGSYWREIGAVNFQKLRSIKQYFEIAFGNASSDVFDSAANGYIHALSAFRNCITHNAGKVDESFKKAVSRFGEFGALNVGDRLELDGDLVRRLRAASVETALSMLSLADGALQTSFL